MAQAIEPRRAVTYCNHDGVELAGDLYLPQPAGPHPCVICVHGGGWRVGAREAMAVWGPHLAARGYAVFTISYRLAAAGKKTYPHAVHDVLAAVQFIRGEAESLGIDPARIALMGASAGAHLSALVALATQANHFTGAYPQDKYGSVDATVKAVVGIFGVYDMAACWQDFLRQTPRGNAVEQFLGAAPMDDRKLYFEASPLSYAVTANNKVAVLLAWGTEDDLVDVEQQSRPFMLALKQAGFFVRSSVIQGAPHYWTGDPIDEPDSFSGFFAPRLLRFLAERL
jgi:acetyl esterase/lipase